MGYPNINHGISQHKLGYPSFDDLFQAIPGYPKIKQKQMGNHRIT